MIDYFAVSLLLVHAVRQWVITDQSINDGFKHDVEVLHQQEVCLVGIDKNLSCFVKEGITEFP